MLWRLVLIISLAGCGRIGFESASQPDDAFVHDDDGDGVGDLVDTCPCIVGSQMDSDGDGLGDACDPNPMVARDRLQHFWTMSAADNPFTTATVGPGTWIQREDGL